MIRTTIRTTIRTSITTSTTSAMLCALAVVCPARPARADTAAQATAFHYGAAPPVESLAFFPRVVLDPDQAPAAAVSALLARGTTVLARLRCARTLATAALLDRAAAAVATGFVGFLVQPEGAWTAADVAALVHAVHARWPIAPVWLEATPGMAARATAEIAGLVAGPLFCGFDAATGRYLPVPEQARGRRIESLAAFARTSGLPVIDVESRPPGTAADKRTDTRADNREDNREDDRALAARVDALGFVPWVAPGARDRLGLGLIQAVPRRILVALDGAEEPYLPFAVAHRMLAVPLEYLGFAVDYLDIRAGLPDRPLTDRYAGLVTWFTDDDMPAPDRYQRWLEQQLDGGLRVVVLGHVGFAPTETFRRRLDIELLPGPPRAPVRIARADAFIGFESPPAARTRDLPPFAARAGAVRHLEIADADGRIVSPVFEGAWGGMALDPYLIASGFEGRQRWIIDPFRFLASALALPDMPVPDVTTENGRRLMEIHVDGDGFVSIAELPHHPLAGEVIRRDFLARYHLPTTVSIIEGEIGAAGLYPARTPQLEPVARAIFELPEVEVASHTYSHPFDWLRAQGEAPRAGEPDEQDAIDGDRLDIPGYTYSVEREIDGSVRYIDGHLAPSGKPTRVLLWSGNALPPEDAIARADALGLANLNGDNAEEPGPTQTLAGVPSFVRPVGQRLQIYAPAQNENVYTNLWHGPYYGFRRVIDYFRFTDTPRRLKPIGIYYHFYSGTKAASVSALHDVYAWALTQETFPMWVSEYTAKVKGFQQAVLARRLDGVWLLRDFGALRTVRLPEVLGWPDLARSPDVAGVRDLPQGQGRYVALAPSSLPVRALAVGAAPPAAPYLEAANAAVISSRRQGDQLWFDLRGHVPVEVTVGGCAAGRDLALAAPASSDATAGGGGAAPRLEGRRLHFDAHETGEVHVVCR